MPQAFKAHVNVKKMDTLQRIVYGEVYCPNSIDSHGDMMLPFDVQVMCWDTVLNVDHKSMIDTNHDNIPNGCYPVEFFIARKGDPDFREGAFVMGTKIANDDIWQKFVTGKLNGYSFEGLVHKVDAEVEISCFRDNFIVTEKSQDHDHYAIVMLDEYGTVIGGRTSVTDGHYHEIKTGTATETIKTISGESHGHRFIVPKLD